MHYHVAPSTFRLGDDLLCFDELEIRGEAPMWKYDGEPFDTDVVCLFESLVEAEVFVADWLPDGQILAVDLRDADDVRLTRVSEGYPAVFTRIPAAYITRAEG